MVAVAPCAAQTVCFGPSGKSAPELLVRSRTVAGRVVVLYLPLGAGSTEVWSLRAGEPEPNAHSWLVPDAPATGIARAGFVDLAGYAPPPTAAGAEKDVAEPEGGTDAVLADEWPPRELATAVEAPPPDGAWLSSPALPGFRFKARLGATPLVVAAACPRSTLCLGPSAEAPAQLFARVTARQSNGKRWLLAGKLADAAADLWVQQGSSGPIRQYSLAARAAGSSWLPSIVYRAAFSG